MLRKSCSYWETQSPLVCHLNGAFSSILNTVFHGGTEQSYYSNQGT